MAGAGRRENAGFLGLAFHRKERLTEVDQAAYSQDGYLVNQGKLTRNSYGSRSSRENGCGWIACYNFLKAMGRERPPQEVAGHMEHMLLWGGRVGSHPLAVWWYLHRQGYRFFAAFTCAGWERALARRKAGPAGIVAYWHGRGAHFAAFVREREKTEENKEENQAGGQEELRFLNAVYGAENHRLSARAFYKKYVRFPLIFVLTERGT